MQRDIAIDMVKAIGILLVVVGHAGIFWPVEKAIYSMHMPLFFLIAGYLHRYRTIKDVVLVKLKTLIIPYVVVANFSFIFFKRESFSDISITNFLFNILIGSSDGLYFNSPLWFLPCIFSMFVIVAIFDKIISFFYVKILLIFIFGVCFTVFIHPLWFSVPFRADTAVSCLPFFCVGLCMSRKEIEKNNIVDFLYVIVSDKNVVDNELQKKSYIFLMLITCGLIWIVFSFIDRNAYYVIAHGKYVPLGCFYIKGISGSMFIVYLCRFIIFYLNKMADRWSVIFFSIMQKISLWSFCIYIFHKPIMTFTKEFLQSYHCISEYHIQTLLIILGMSLPVLLIKITSFFSPKTANLILGSRIDLLN